MSNIKSIVDTAIKTADELAESAKCNGSELLTEYKKYSDSATGRNSRMQTSKQIGQAIGAAAAGGAGIGGSLWAGAGVITAKVAAVAAIGVAAAPYVAAAATVTIVGAGLYGVFNWLNEVEQKTKANKDKE